MVVTVEHDEVGVLAQGCLQFPGRLVVLQALVIEAQAVGVVEGDMQEEEHRLVGVVRVNLVELLVHPFHRGDGVLVVVRPFEAVLAAVESHEVEAIDVVVVGTHNLLRTAAEVDGLRGIFALGEFAHVLFHRIGVIVGRVVFPRAVAPFGQFILMVARYVEHRCLLAVLEGAADGVMHQFLHCLPHLLLHLCLAGAVAANEDDIDILLLCHLLEDDRHGAAQLNPRGVSGLHQGFFTMEVGDTADGEYRLFACTLCHNQYGNKYGYCKG